MTSSKTNSDVTPLGRSAICHCGQPFRQRPYIDDAMLYCAMSELPLCGLVLGCSTISPSLCTAPPHSQDGHVDVARLLLDHGAQVNMPADSFESPLTLAASGGHYELAALLISRGADLEEVNDEG